MMVQSLLKKCIFCYFFVCLLFSFLIVSVEGAGKGKGKKGKGKGKNILPFQRVNEDSRVATERSLPGAPKVVKASHFQFNYKLGHKIWLVCLISGTPLPIITWYKDGSEIVLKDSIWIEQKNVGSDQVYSKIEIDPSVLGDSGIYTCMASNNVTNMMKNFKVEMV